MLFLIGEVFAATLLFSQVLGVGLAGIGCSLLLWSSLLTGSTIRVNAKDAAFLVYAGLGSTATVLHGGAYELTFYARLVFYPWLVSLLFQNLSVSYPRARMLLGTVVVVSIVVGAIMVFQAAPGVFDFSFNRLVGLDRQRGFYFLSDEPSGPNSVAYMTAIGIAAALGIGKGGKLSLWWFVAVGVLLVLLVASGGRIAWAAVITIVLLAALFDGAGHPAIEARSIAIATAAVAAALGIGWWLGSQILVGASGAGFAERLAGLANPTEDESFSVRAIYWGAAIEMFLSNPWGHGFNAYFERFGRTPHNELLGQLVASGWHGTVGYVILMVVSVFLVFRAWRSASAPRERMMASAAVYCSVIIGLAMITENVSRAGMKGVYPAFWMLVGAALARSSRLSQASEQGNHGA